MAANYKTTIGIFTVIGLLLFLLGMIFLGGHKFFSSKSEYVLYFEGSVRGLSVGAPVVFRGVPLGNVTSITVVFNPKSSEITIPVHIRIDENSITRITGKEISDVYQEEIIRHMVQNGLCASLQIQSLVTGQYEIELDYHPNTPQKFRSSTPNNEIPTVPSPMDQLQTNLAQLPLDEICESFKTILISLANALQDGSELKNSIASFHATFDELDQILKASTLRVSSENIVNKLTLSADTIASNLPTILNNIRTILAELSDSSTSLKKTAAFTQNLMNNNSPAIQDVRRLLKEASEAARSLHNLADMLNRNPEALLSGKKGSR